MRWLYTLLYLWPVALLGAAGDITGAWIGSNGWTLNVRVSTILTNGTFAWSYTTNTFPFLSNGVSMTDTTFTPPSNVRLDFTSQAYDDTGQLTTASRTIYGTKQLRIPGTSLAAIYADGSDAIAVVALDDFVTSTCSNLTLTVGANWYSNNNACSSIEVTNLSVILDPKCVAQWACVPFQVIQSNTMTIAVSAYHSSGRIKKPVRAVKFVAVGTTSGLSVTQIVTTPSVDWRRGNANPVPTYWTDIDISGMTQGELIGYSAEVYPWYGGTNAVTSTFSGRAEYTPYLLWKTNVCDRLGTYGWAWAVVDVTGSNLGVVSSNSTVTWPSVCFSNIGQAMNAICKSNAIWYGTTRSNTGNSFIYVNDCDGAWFGTAPANGVPYPWAWCTITRYPTNTAVASVVTNGVNYTDSFNRRIRVYDMSIRMASSIGLANLAEDMWFDHVIWDNGLFTSWNANKTNVYVTQCIVSNIGAAGFQGSSAVDVRHRLIEGNYLYTTNSCPMVAYCTIGNKRFTKQTAVSSTQISTDYTTSNPKPDCGIVAYNDLRGLNQGAILIFNGSYLTNGFALVGNIVENYTAANALVCNIGANITSDVTNMIVWNNAFLGNRSTIAYNWEGTGPFWRVQWSLKNNLFDQFNIKGDNFTTVDATRTGNWACAWGVAWTGNISPMTTNASAANNLFACDWMGWNSWHRLCNLTNWFDFVDMESYANVVRSGMGNYRVNTSSPITFWNNVDYPIPVDIEANTVGSFGPPGPYGSASPRKGGGFF